jgi:uncharacterized protein (DUF433 family)
VAASAGPEGYTQGMSDGIVTKPDVLGGKPCVEGTRISVELILELFASGGTQESILRAYPQLSPGSLAAALAFAARSLKNEVVWEVKVSA